jgi:ubiquinone/menaquinone biosynthesis C-methylase UbiE
MAPEVVTMSEEHWDSIYIQRRPEDLAWHEPLPSTLSLVTAFSDPTDRVIDVGGGTSTLAIELVRRGYEDVTILDISEQALGASRTAMWQHTGAVHWVHADLLEFRPDRNWQLWHDRAVFHFLTEPAQRDAYRNAAATTVAPGGTLIVATFAPDGPEMCAGLPVRRYTISALAAEFVPEFELVEGNELTPPSADGDQRPYVAVVMRRTAH